MDTKETPEVSANSGYLANLETAVEPAMPVKATILLPKSQNSATTGVTAATANSVYSVNLETAAAPEALAASKKLLQKQQTKANLAVTAATVTLECWANLETAAEPAMPEMKEMEIHTCLPLFILRLRCVIIS